MGEPALPRREVVTAFLRHGGKILLVRRSKRVGSYQGRWSAISGYLERASPLEQALQEIAEAQIGLFVARADAVLVGADSLLPDGSVLNKAGTYPLALAARDQGLPFYVCCEGFKRRAPDMEPPLLEAMDASELGAPALAGVAVRNIYFDLTPARLVSAWFDERGMHAAGFAGAAPRGDNGFN